MSSESDQWGFKTQSKCTNCIKVFKKNNLCCWYGDHDIRIFCLVYCENLFQKKSDAKRVGVRVTCLVSEDPWPLIGQYLDNSGL